MNQPFKAGDKFADHARPIAEVMAQLQRALTELEKFKKAHPDLATMNGDQPAYQGRLTEL